MEKFDPSRELQVWQRVGEGPRRSGEDIRPLLLLAWEQASVLRQLNPARQRMRSVSEEARRSVEALKGIAVMSGQTVSPLQPVPIPKEPARRQLEKCFHRSNRLMTEYTARSLDPEFGVVFQQLADRERKTAAVLAELVGEWRT